MRRLLRVQRHGGQFAGACGDCRNTDAIVCHAIAHINVDECGAPGFISGGAKLLTIDTPHAKLTPDAVIAAAVTPHDEHSSRPRALALTQATEFGTVYSPREIAALCDVAHARKMRVQMDGARFANAVAALGCAPADITWRAGVDVLCLGGTKNGLPFGEAIVFFDRELADEFARRRKQAGQLASKMRFLAAPWLGVLEDGAWLRHAAHANAMAQRLARRPRGSARARLLAPVQGERRLRRSADAPRSMRCTESAGGSTNSSAQPAFASCARGTRPPKPSTAWSMTCARPSRGCPRLARFS